jgi:hypothetical protein
MSVPSSAVRFPVIPEQPRTSDVVEIIGTFFMKGQVGEAVQNASRLFGPAARGDDHDWHSACLRRLFDQLPPRFPASACRIQMDKFCAGAGASPDTPILWGDMREVMCALEVMDLMARAAVCMAVVVMKFGTAAEALREHQLKLEAEQAVTLARSTVSQALNRLSAGAFGDTARWATTPFSMPVAQAKAWFLHADTVLPILCKHMLSFAVGASERLAAETTSLLPNYAYIVNDSTFNEKLARRQLLASPSRDALGTASLALFQSLTAISRLHSAWSVTPALDDEDEYASVAAGRAAFATARAALTTIAAVSVVLEKTGQDQRDQAATLLAKQRDSLPKALRERLAGVLTT